MKMYLISDNIDTYTGMRLAGVEGVVVHERAELKDALEHTITEEGALKAQMSTGGEIQSEAVQALVALGYGNTEALKAVKQVEITPDMQVEELLKRALKFMF